ncbi:MAG TPA: hypothetical protein VKA48_01915 [Gammaproteobacteria bacterium]|nr:hypothetical protein [Gammaproteobacteria bacterium]
MSEKRIWPLVALALAGLLVLLLAWVWPAQAQELRPGVGLDLPQGTTLCWQGGQHYPLQTQYRPWGEDGSGSVDIDAYHLRYHGGTSPRGAVPCGQAAEVFHLANQAALKAAYAGECPALDRVVHPMGHDGNPTQEELWDLALSHRRCGTMYRTCWYEQQQGGSPEDPILIDSAFEWTTWSKGLGRSRWPCSTGQTFERPGAMCDWPTYYRVGYLPEERPWCGASEPPPEPDPEPEPPGPPECSPACKRLALLDARAAEEFPRAYRLPSGRADLCDGESADPPRDECRWQVWPRHLRARRKRLREQCLQDVESGCRYVPGVPSTGRVEVELVPGEGGGR